MSLPRFGPLRAEHYLVGGICRACDLPFQVGDTVTLIALGPGGDPEAQEAARDGRAYNAIAIPVHHACATGEP